jgi:hypothetical protein
VKDLTVHYGSTKGALCGTPSGSLALSTSLKMVDCEDCLEAHRRSDPNYDPSPYCSYGHMTKAQCDCGPIAENE